jgi:hypothetical protein
MTIIKVPKPPKSAFNKDRKVSSLLRMQMELLQHAELRLPARQQTNIYINAIKKEGDAADYIRRVTQALHAAHGRGPTGASAAREMPMRKGKGSEKHRSSVKRKT